MTAILALPEISMPISIETGEDWLDAIAFYDASGLPLALDGILFHLQVRVAASDNEIFFEATTADGSLQILASSALISVASSGVGYVVGDLIHAATSDAIVPMTIKVTAVGGSGAVTAASIADPGIYTILPGNPATQGSTSGSGSGATFNLTWINNALVIAVASATLPAKFVAGQYVYGIQVTAEGYTMTLASGDLTLTDGVVR